ncbi:hypothetical protein [Devosia sp.]|uniref:hypothetical protein n=1 Tax=Devosia sp. TaxID=1871048 RepID=UPI002FC64BA5
MDSRDVIVRHAVLVAFCNDSKDHPHFMGEAIGYYDQPVYMLQSNGKECTWAASLCREATPEEAIEYWRNRALKAEDTMTGGSGEG